jgi:hypothetical protein
MSVDWRLAVTNKGKQKIFLTIFNILYLYFILIYLYRPCKQIISTTCNTQPHYNTPWPRPQPTVTAIRDACRTSGH